MRGTWGRLGFVLLVNVAVITVASFALGGHDPRWNRFVVAGVLLIGVVMTIVNYFLLVHPRRK